MNDDYLEYADADYAALYVHYNLIMIPKVVIKIIFAALYVDYNLIL